MKVERTLENSAGFQEFTNGIKVGFRNFAIKFVLELLDVVKFTRL